MKFPLSIGRKLQRLGIWKVKIRGVDVVLEIGGRDTDPMHPDTAIDIGLALYTAGRDVKKRHHMGATVHGIARLTDAVADEREMQKSRDGTAVFARVK